MKGEWKKMYTNGEEQGVLTHMTPLLREFARKLIQYCQNHGEGAMKMRELAQATDVSIGSIKKYLLQLRDLKIIEAQFLPVNGKRKAWHVSLLHPELIDNIPLSEPNVQKHSKPTAQLLPKEQHCTCNQRGNSIELPTVTFPDMSQVPNEGFEYVFKQGNVVISIRVEKTL